MKYLKPSTVMTMKPAIDHFVEGPFIQFGQQYTARGRSWTKRVFSDKSVEIYPGVLQHTPEYIRFLLHLHKSLQKVSLWQDSVRGENHYSGPNQVLIDWGSGPAALLPPMEDNSKIREDKGLRDPDLEEKILIKELIARVIRAGSATSIHFKKVSSCGFPFMETGLQLKKSMYNEVLERLERFLILTASENYEERFREFRSYPAYTNGVRWQADTVKQDAKTGQLSVKNRYSYALLEDGSVSDRFCVNLPVLINGIEQEGVFCARWRSMYALSRHDNVFMQMVNNYCHEGAKKTIVGLDYKGPDKLVSEIKDFFAKHPKREAIEESKQRVITLDKSEFGETFNSFCVEAIVDEIGNEFGDIMRDYVRVCIDAVCFFRGQFKGKSSLGITRGDLRKPVEQRMRGSFKSGNGLVAFIGEMLGAIDAMLLSRRAFKDTIYGWTLEQFMANSHPCFIYKGKGDDTLFATDAQGKELLEKAVNEGISLHKDELETFAKFLGYFYNNTGNVHVDMAKYLESSVGSERGWKAKTLPAFGSLMKEVQYEANPKYGEIREILHKNLYDHCKFDLAAWQNTFRDVEPYNKDYAIFLENPDKLLYQDYLKDSIPEEVYREIYSDVGAENVNDVLERIRNL